MGQLAQIFEYSGVRVRTVVREGEPWFVASDVCEVLGIANSRDAVGRLGLGMKDDVGVTDTIGRVQSMSVISESGIYKLAFRSRKEEAERFTDWVAGEVLPSVRKHGGYLTPEKVEEALLNPDTIIRLATSLKEERERREVAEVMLQEAAPKVEFFDRVADCGDNYDMKTAAAMLDYRGMGQNNLFDFLRGEGVLQRDKTPYREQLEAGRFEVAMKRYARRNRVGEEITETYPQTRVTTKGLAYIQKLLDGAGYRPAIERGA